MVDLATLGAIEPGAGPAGAASAGTKAVTTQSFAADVLTASQRRPVLVHFESKRSEACKSVQAALERAVKGSEDKLALVTMDIDAHPQVASRLGVRAVPAVYAFDRGQPIDGFTGALPEAQIKGFLERLIGPLADDFEAALAEAEAALAEGDAQGAASIFSAVMEQEPAHLGAVAGLARAFVAAGELDAAREILAQVPPASAKDKGVQAAQAALNVAEQASGLGDLGELKAKVDADPDDHQASLDYALGLNGLGKREEAAEVLLASMKRDRDWNEAAAKKQLLQFFEVWGLMDPMTLAARRKLSTLLFS